MRSRFGRAAFTGAAVLLVLSACAPSAPPQASPTPGNAQVDARMASELQRAAERANMCSGREAVAAGLRAEYFAKPGMQGKTLLARMEGPVDDDWPKVSSAVRSARWRGWVRPPISGRYRFHTDHPGATIRVSGQIVSSPELAASGSEAPVELAAGRYHPITVELAQLPASAPPAPLRLSWTAPHGARYVIPRAVLYPPSDTVTDTIAAAATPTR